VRVAKVILDLDKKTLKLRHAIVKMIAPQLYYEAVFLQTVFLQIISAIPRPMTLFMKAYFGSKQLVGLEIGVAKGENALSILQELPIRKLFLIDPYIPYVERGQPLSFEETFVKAKERLSKFQQVTFIKKTSEEAVKDVDEPLDFVYIDGNHSYEYVKNDIALYYPLVKLGGVIGGHDYTPYHRTEVVQAVNEFVKKHGKIGFYTVFPDWWIIKKWQKLEGLRKRGKWATLMPII